MKKLVGLLPLLVLPGISFAQITLSPGDDIQHAVDQNPPGTTFTLLPGTYAMQMIVPKDGDAFIGQPGATLSGAVPLNGFGRLGSLWAATNQTQQGQLNGYCDAQHPRCAFPEDLFFDDVPLLHVNDISLLAPRAWFFDYANQIIYFVDDPTGHKVETSVARSAFSGTSSNVMISGLIIEKYAVPGQFGAIGDQYPGPNWVIANNEIRWNHGAAINIADGAQVTGNYIHHNGEKGVGGGGQNLLLQGNEIAFNNWAGFDPGWDSAGAKFAQTTGLVARSNFVHDNVGPGFWSDVDSINTLYQDNVIEGNTGAGIQYEVSYAATIRDNVIRDNSVPGTGWMWGAQILIQNSRDVAVFGNTVEVARDRGNGIGIIQQDRGDGLYGPHVSANNYIHHNSITHRLSPQGVSGSVGDYDGSSLRWAENNLFDYNSYHVTSPEAYHWMWGGFQNWAGMRQMGQELNGTLDTNLPPSVPPHTNAARRGFFTHVLPGSGPSQ